MALYDLAKKNHDRGLWTKEMLEKLVKRGLLGRQEAGQILAGTVEEQNETARESKGETTQGGEAYAGPDERNLV